MKVLPRAPFESKEVAKIVNSKVQSCRNPTKVMFVGAIAPPDSYKDADGKIMVRRVSKKIASKGVSISKTFVPEFLINDTIKEGEWHKFFDDAEYISIHKAMEIICNHYDIKVEVSACMNFCYTTYMFLGKRKQQFGCMEPPTIDCCKIILFVMKMEQLGLWQSLTCY